MCSKQYSSLNYIFRSLVIDGRPLFTIHGFAEVKGTLLGDDEDDGATLW